jgi:PAS domain S-box-containing protein
MTKSAKSKLNSKETTTSEQIPILNDSKLEPYQELFMQAPALIAVLRGKEGVCELFNPLFSRLWDSRDVIGKPMREAWPELEGQGWFEMVEKILKTGKPISGSEKSAIADWDNNGKQTERFFNFTYAPFVTPSGKIDGVMIFGFEVTDQVIARKKLEESERRFRNLAEAVPQLVWITAADGTLEYFNSNWYEYTGTAPKNTIHNKFIDVLHPDDKSKIRTAWVKAIETGEPLSVEYRIRAKDGSYHWFLGRGVPQHDDKGSVVKWYGTCTNIDDVKQQHEVEKRMERLTEQRNALVKLNKTKDEFIALASHQLRTPATAVKQYISLLIDEVAGPVTADQIQFLQTAYNNNERQLNIINDLLKTAQLDSSRYTLDKTPQDMVIILEEVIDDLESSFELKKQKVVLETSHPTIKATVDRNEIKLVLLNLVENASKYTYPNKQIKIEVKKKSKYLDINVSDEGVGISAENLKKIFDKFTRIENDLSDTVTGSGLGLYWVKRIVKLHKGKLSVNSELKKGTTFTIRLPL